MDIHALKREGHSIKRIAAMTGRSGNTDPLQRAVQFAYDAADRVTAQTLPDGRVVGFTYDANGNYTLGYDPNTQQLRSVTAPDGSSLTYGYTGAFACLAGAIWFAARRRRLAEHIRPIYIERGILTWNDGTTQPVDSGRIR